MSKKIYCIASFKPKAGKEEAVFKALQTLEPNTHREDACLHYTVTRQIDNPFAQGTSYPIAKHVESPDGDIEDANVCVYTDEPWNFDAPKV